jgi:replicative DNA helicase
MLKKTDNKPWVSSRHGYREALEYLDGRRKGLITSYKTPWPKANDAGVDGLEWHSTIVIGGRPGAGKTLIKNQIIREGFKLNPGQGIRVLEFNFEMAARVTAIREFSAVLGKSYKQLCSADKDMGPLKDAELQQLVTHSKKQVEYPVDVIEKKKTVRQMDGIIRDYMNTHSSTENYTYADEKTGKDIPATRTVYTPTIITIDHSILVGREERQSFLDMLYSLGETITDLKREFPIIFIVLSQLGRQVENPERSEDGKYANYILESDLFGGDALYQHADMCICINRPAKRFIKFFGPQLFIIDDDKVLVWHFLKVRNGDPRMSFFRAKYETMEVVEMPTPGTKKLNTQQ